MDHIHRVNILHQAPDTPSPLLLQLTRWVRAKLTNNHYLVSFNIKPHLLYTLISCYNTMSLQV